MASRKKIRGDTKDIVVYCDGFLKNAMGTEGCSVAVIINNKKIFHKFYFIRAIKEENFLKIIERSHPITVPITEMFAVYRGLQTADKLFHRYNQMIIVYSDSLFSVNLVTGLWQPNAKAMKLWTNKCKFVYNLGNKRLLWIRRTKIEEILGH
jgi:ribonuclease HI